MVVRDVIVGNKLDLLLEYLLEYPLKTAFSRAIPFGSSKKDEGM